MGGNLDELTPMRLGLGIGLLVLVAAAMRIVAAQALPYWSDESVFFYYYRFPLPWSEKYWMLAGDLIGPAIARLIDHSLWPNELWLRMPNLLATTVLVALLPFCGNLRPRTRLLAALFATFGWLGVFQGFEARSYGIIMLSGFWFQQRLLLGRAARSRLVDGIVLIPGLLAGSPALVAVAVTGGLLALDRRRRPEGLAWMGIAFACFGVWKLLFGPVDPTLEYLRVMFGWGNPIWNPEHLTWFFGAPGVPAVISVFVLVGAALRNQEGRQFLYIGVAGLAAILVAILIARMPMVPRYAAFAWPWFLLAFAVGVDDVWRSSSRGGKAVVLAAVMCWIGGQVSAWAAVSDANRKPHLSADVTDLMNQIMNAEPGRFTFAVEIEELFTTTILAYHPRQQRSDWLLVETGPYFLYPVTGKHWMDDQLWAQDTSRNFLSLRAATAITNAVASSAGQPVWWLRPQYSADPCVPVQSSCWAGVFGTTRPDAEPSAAELGASSMMTVSGLSAYRFPGDVTGAGKLLDAIDRYGFGRFKSGRLRKLPPELAERADWGRQ